MVQPSLTHSQNPFNSQQRLVSVKSAEQFDPSSGHFSRSLQPKQLTSKELIKIANTRLFSKAINVISDGVVAMSWTISPEKEFQKDEEYIQKAKTLTQAMENPNRGNHDTYEAMVRALIRDLLIFNVCVIERQPAEYDRSQPFWLWDVSAQDIELDPDWNPKFEGIQPRFWFAPKDADGRYLSSQDEWEPIYNRNMFFVIHRSATYELIPPSPVKLAYDDVCTWLGVRGYQNREVSSGAVSKYLLSIENAGQDEIEHFREYWNTHIVNTGEVPIIGGKVNVVQLGAKTDDELFPKFAEILVGLVALEFGLSQEDYGIRPHDNRATRETVSKIAFHQGVLPIAQTLIKAFDKKVVRFYAPGFKMGLADTEPRNEDEEATTANELYQGGILTKNEARKRIGEDPVLEGGDEFVPKPEAPPPKSEQQPVAASKQLELFSLETYGNGNGSTSNGRRKRNK